MPTPREQLASILKQSRTEAGFDSHGALAKRLNVSRPVVSKAENPAQPVPSDALLAAWAGVTGVPLDSADGAGPAGEVRYPRVVHAVPDR